MTNFNYESMLLSELRLVTIQKPTGDLTNENLQAALTVDANLQSLGYTLRPNDIVNLAMSDSLQGFYDQVKTLVGDVKAAPMYPNFPKQVMEMDKAEFRFHQAVHYFSTYGLEAMFGGTVLRGWMPDVKATEKTKTPKRLRTAHVLACIYEDTMYTRPLKMILSKRERMTGKDSMICDIAFQHVSAMFIQTLDIPFKANLLHLFYMVFGGAYEDKLAILHALCKHTGDVLKCADYCLCQYHYHFRTSQKRLLVKLLESYPVVDLLANLVLSSKKAHRSNLVLQYLDYNMYSRSAGHKAAVDSLRDGKLRSWESRAKYLVSTGNDGALDFIAQRPGMLLRMITWLLRNGYADAKIENILCDKAASLSLQTITTVLSKFGNKRLTEEDTMEANRVYAILLNVLTARLYCINTPLYGKKMYVKQDQYDLAHSIIQSGEKSDEGGYIRSGIAYAIPENIHRIRLFVYWNDKQRVDVDLHAAARNADGTLDHVGWNSEFIVDNGIVFSGDITHSDAAEYIDVDLDATTADSVDLNINLFNGKPSFGEIDECFVGIMAVNELGEEIKLYSHANCFFSHQLTSKSRNLNYGYLDIKNRCLLFLGQDTSGASWPYYTANTMEKLKTTFTLEAYIEALVAGQNIQIVDTDAEADVVLVMGKPENDREVSLMDNNYFFDTPIAEEKSKQSFFPMW